ncbi:GAF domain-containing protein [Candidatus Solincola sp.]
MRRLFAGLRFRILLVVAVAFLPAFVLLFLHSIERRRDVVDTARLEAFRLTENVAAEYVQRVDDIRRLLSLLSYVPEVRGRNWKESSALFGELLARSPELVNVIAVDADGNVVASAVPYQGPLNLSDRSFFQRAVQTKEFSIGDYVVGRITGKPLLPFALPVLNEKEEVVFLLVAAWDLSWLEKMADSFFLPEGSVLTVVDGMGTVLARYPEGEGYVGTTVPEAPVVKAMLEEAGGGSMNEVGLDGVRRLYVHRPIMPEVETGRVYVCLGFPEEEIYGPANRTLAWELAILAVFAALVILLAYALSGVFIIRPISNLQKAVQELERGNLRARSGLSGALGEMGHLAKSFDRMAESLQARVEERDRAEARLRENEKRLSDIVTTVPVGIITTDSRGEVGFVNRAALSILGSEEEAIIGRSYEDLFAKVTTLDGHPLPAEEHPFRRILDAGMEFRDVEYLVELENGTTRALSFSGLPLRDEEENVMGVLAAVEDVTERHRSRERARRLGLLYAVLSEVNRAIVHLKEKQLLLQEICRILVERGLFRMAWVGWLDPSSLVVEPVAVAGDRTGYAREISVRADDSPLGLGPTGRAVVEGHPVICDDVENDPRMEPWRDKLLRAGFRSSGAFPLRREGKVVGVINVYAHLPGYFGPEEREIMERLAADVSFALQEGRRRAAEERIRQINYCLLNLGSNPLHNMERISALSREVLGCALAQYWRRSGDVYRLAFHESVVEGYIPTIETLSREDLEEVVLWWRGPLAGEGARLSRLLGILPEVAEYGWRSMLCHPVLLGAEFVGCLCLFDREEREFRDEEVDYAGMLARALAVEEERWRREESLRDLMDITSHELRHPITIMKGYSITLLQFSDRLSEEEKREMFRRIDRAADRLTLILAELIDLVRVERGTLGISPRKVPVHSLVQAAVEEAREKHEDRKFRILLKEETEKAFADPEKLTFALSALLDNAAKFSPPGEEVILEAGRVGDEIVFSVLDRGPGIPSGDEARIFERFYHVGEVRYHSIPGMGLGLYIARAIVNAHDGRIWYKPREGGGSIFSIAVPAG